MSDKYEIVSANYVYGQDRQEFVEDVVREVFDPEDDLPYVTLLGGCHGCGIPVIHRIMLGDPVEMIAVINRLGAPDWRCPACVLAAEMSPN